MVISDFTACSLAPTDRAITRLAPKLSLSVLLFKKDEIVTLICTYQSEGQHL